MIIALLILIGLFFYFLIGRTVINLLGEHTDTDYDDWKGLAIVIFPLVLIWGGIMIGSDYLTEAVTEFFENQNKTNR